MSLAHTAAAYESWSRTKDRAARTAPARKAGPNSIEYWEARVDPDEEMTLGDRVKAAQNARKAYFLRLAQASAKARAARKAAQ